MSDLDDRALSVSRRADYRGQVAAPSQSETQTRIETLPLEIEGLIGLLPDSRRVVERLHEEPQLIQLGVAARVRLLAERSERVDLFHLANLIERSVIVGIDDAVDEISINQRRARVWRDESADFDALMSAATAVGQRWVRGGWDQLRALFEGLCDRASQMAASEEQDRAVRQLLTGCLLAAASVDRDATTLVAKWVQVGSWYETLDWSEKLDRLMDPSSGLLDPYTLTVLEVLATVWGARSAADHLAIVRRQAELIELPHPDPGPMLRGEVGLWVAARAALARSDGSDESQLERLGVIAAAIGVRVARDGAGWLCEVGVVVAEQAVELARATNDPRLGISLDVVSHNLASWIKRFSGPAARYTDAVTYAEEAVQLARTTNDPNLGMRLDSLSNRLAAWIDRFGGPAARYPQAVTYAEEAVQLARTTNDPNLGEMLDNLSNHLAAWIDRFSGPATRYPQAVTYAEEAVQLARTTNDPNLGVRLNNLSVCLDVWIGQFHGAADRYHEAVTYAEEAVQLARTTNDPNLGEMLVNLSNHLARWINRFSGPAARYPQAITYAEEAVQLARTTNDPRLGGMLYNLSNHLAGWINRFSGPAARYPQAVTYAEEAVQLARTTNDPNLGEMLVNLSNHLARWIDRFGGPAARYPQAVTYAEEAVELARTTNDPRLGSQLNSLSNHLAGWIDRFSGPAARYPQAVTYAEEAVQLARTTNDPNLGEMLDNLSNHLAAWIDRFGGPAARYPQAVTYAEEAVQLARTTNDPNLGGILNNLSNHFAAWIDRFGGPATRYPQAVTYAEEAVQLARTTNHPNLGMRLDSLSNHLAAWIDRFSGPATRYPQAVTYAEEAVQLARTTNDPNLGEMLDNLSNHLAAWIERFGGSTERRADVVRFAVDYVVERAKVDDAESVMRGFARQFPDLASRAASELVAIGNLDGAIAALEAVRGVRLGEVSARTATELDDLATIEPDLVDRYRSTIERLRMLEHLAPADPSLCAPILALRAEINQTVQEIRFHVPSFARSADVTTLQARLTRSQRVVWLVPAANDRILLLVLGPDTLDTIDCPLDDRELRGATAAGIRFPLGPHATNDLGVTDIDLTQDDDTIAVEFDAALAASVVETCRLLWDGVASPLLATLPDDVDELILVPVGMLAVLPFHAAGHDATWLIDRVAIRYAPTATNTLTTTINGRGRDAVGPILQPTPVDPHLPCAPYEAAILHAITGSPVITTTCDRLTTRQLLQHATWFHTCSHLQPEPDGRTTALQLANNEQLTVHDCEMLPRTPRTEAFIAACSGKTPGTELPDEIIGFPNALLAAGFQRVIAASWAINDLAACLQSIHYHHHRTQHPDQPAAMTLRDTQRWLRDTPPTRIADWLDQLTHHHPTINPPDLHIIANTLRTIVPDHYFTHPVHWAPLTLTGT